MSEAMMERAEQYPTWTCCRCNTEYVDPEDHPPAKKWKNQAFVERPEHWLGTKPLCCNCAAESGIPSIDEE